MGGVFLGFAENLSRLQEQNGESNYKLAKALGVSQTSIANWKNGTDPHPICLNVVANHYGITVDELLKEEPQEGA